METQKDGFDSTLKESVQRGQSRMLNSAFRNKIKTNAELIKDVGIVVLIKSISAEVRGRVFVACNGGGDAVRASKMDEDIVAMTIESMLTSDPPLVTPDDVCREISTDHLVEKLPRKELYRFMFGQPVTSKPFMAEVLRIILEERLLGDRTASSYLRAIGDDKIIHENTPTHLLVLGQQSMLVQNRNGTVFTDDDLVVVYTPGDLVEYVELSDLFGAVQAVAELNGWIEKKPSLPEGVVTPSEFPPKSETSDSDDEPEMSVGTEDEIEEEVVTVDGDEEAEDATQVGSIPPALATSGSRRQRRSRS